MNVKCFYLSHSHVENAVESVWMREKYLTRKCLKLFIKMFLQKEKTKGKYLWTNSHCLFVINFREGVRLNQIRGKLLKFLKVDGGDCFGVILI